ncbi:tripartite tricarboxylate transporter TctB family protein [Corynebacterium flavescens]
MADEKQLTVAELLARNNKERSAHGDASSEGEGSRRRHRRSIDEGGISVAELTGNLEKVKATPAQSKHSSVPIDKTAPVIPAPPAPAEEEKPEQEHAKAATPVKPAESAKSAESQKPAKPDAGKAASSDTDKAASSDTDKAASSDTDSAPSLDVDKQPAEEATAKKPQPSTDDTTVFNRVPQAPAAVVEPESKAKVAQTPAAVEEEPSSAAGQGAAVATPAEDIDSEAIDGEAAESEFGPELESDSEEGEEEDSKLNAFSIILLAVIGIVVGAVVFKGFEILWDRFDRIVVAVLAIMVTAASMGAVHALRTVRDRFSMVLAAFVGLVLTFGPLLLVM